VFYVVGHGSDEVVVFDSKQTDYLYTMILQEELDKFSNDIPMLIMINACHSGSFITSSHFSISAPNRIIITTAHDDQVLFGVAPFASWVYLSDRFWKGINCGDDVRSVFCDASFLERHYMWLDDNGDRIAHPPHALGDDGELAKTITIGVPGTDQLPLAPWCLAVAKSPVELRIYDEQGRVTGIVNGQPVQQIPGSFCDPITGAVIVFGEQANYINEIKGIESGDYGFQAVYFGEDIENEVVLKDVPIDREVVHQYQIDWDQMDREKGINMAIDQNGDGAIDTVTNLPPAPVISSVQFEKLEDNLSGIKLRWKSIPNVWYTILRSTNVAGPYIPIAEHIKSNPPENTWIDTYLDSCSTNRICSFFYRVVIE